MAAAVNGRRLGEFDPDAGCRQDLVGGQIVDERLQRLLLHLAEADDFDVTEVWRSTTNDRATATKAGESRGVNFFDEGLLSVTIYYYWLRSRDLSGNLSAFHVGDLAGMAVTTSGKIGYKLTLDALPFTGTFTDAIGHCGVAFDDVDRELDWLVRSNGDLHFGETTFHGFVVTALGVKLLA